MTQEVESGTGIGLQRESLHQLGEGEAWVPLRAPEGRTLPCPALPRRCPAASGLAAPGVAAVRSGLRCPPPQSLGKDGVG